MQTLMPDLTTTPFAEILNDRLRAAVQRVADEATNGDDGISAFNSSI